MNDIHTMTKGFAILLIVFLASGTGFAQITGGDSGGSYASGGEQPAQATAIDLVVNLQGAWDGLQMRTGIADSNLLPTQQVFSSNASAPWYYTGAESIYPPADISKAVNWVLLEARTTAGDASTAGSANMVDRQAALLRDDGHITALDAASYVRFPWETPDSLFVVVWSMNHLPVMNSISLKKSTGYHAYDFSSAQHKAFQKAGVSSNPAMADLGGGVFGMFAGDCYPDTIVKFNGTNNDREIILNKVGASQVATVVEEYYIGDLNMDGLIRYTGKENDRTVIYNALGGSLADSLRAHIPD